MPTDSNLSPEHKAHRSTLGFKLSLAYDGAIVLLICFDLLLMMVDALLMSGFAERAFSMLSLSGWLSDYQNQWHSSALVVGGLITIFLISELLIRWFIAIVQKRYYRWFFFPFVHWYEVLGCFPQLRALRLLRAGVIGYQLYQMGYRFLPQSWIDRGVFYYQLVLEELSDRVIVTALGSVERELLSGKGLSGLIDQIMAEHRTELSALTTSLIHEQTTQVLDRESLRISQGVGESVSRALSNVPELSKYLKLIPVAGKLIEREIQQIGADIGSSITEELMRPFRTSNAEEMSGPYQVIQSNLDQVKIDQSELQPLIEQIVLTVLQSIKDQISVKQWQLDAATQAKAKAELSQTQS